MPPRFDGVGDEFLIGCVGLPAHHQVDSQPAVVSLNLLHHLVDGLLGDVVLQSLLLDQGEVFLLQ